MKKTSAVFAALLLVACNHDTGPAPDGGTVDAGNPDAGSGDAGIPDAGQSAYPAPHTAMPHAVKGPGSVMTAPRIVAISFQGDQNQSDVDTFVNELVATTEYWGGATSEYGVGPLATPVIYHAAENAAPTPTDLDVQMWLTTKIQADAGFPQPDANTIYTLFYPTGTTVTVGSGVTCQQLQGYHDAFALPAAGNVIYAVVPRCPPPPVAGVTISDQMAAEASHELIEAATDPLPGTAPAYITVDDSDYAWALVAGGELGDLCAAFPDSFYKPTGIDYLVQRTWSNANAAAGHDPCEPDGSEPYFNSAAVVADTISVTVGGEHSTTKGVKLAVGQSKTIELDLYSDAPTSGPWKISALDVESAFFGNSPALDLSLDKDTGQNGDKVNLTIKLVRAVPGGASFWIENDLGMTSTVWLGAVNTN